MKFLRFDIIPPRTLAVAGFLGFEPGMKKKEFIKKRCMQLLFDWQCHPLWYKIANIIELFIMDAFVDLFITLCIVVNTVFMAVEHANMNDSLVKVLSYGNYVRGWFGLFLLFFIHVGYLLMFSSERNRICNRIGDVIQGCTFM